MKGKKCTMPKKKPQNRGPKENKTGTCHRSHLHLLGHTLLQLLCQHRSMAAAERLQKSFGLQWQTAIQATANSSLQEIQQLAPVCRLKLRS